MIYKFICLVLKPFNDDLRRVYWHVKSVTVHCDEFDDGRICLNFAVLDTEEIMA